MKFTRLSIEEGLSQSVVFAICQDSKGFMWIGTQDGLNRYDGYKFKVYENESFDRSIVSNNDIASIILDKSENLWVGATDNYISKFNSGSDNFSNRIIKSSEDFINPRSHITTIKEDCENNLLIGTYGAGLIKYDVVNDKFQRFKKNENQNGLPSNNISSLFIDTKNQVWIGTNDKGIVILNDEGFDTHSGLATSSQKNQMLNNKIRFIFEDSPDNILIGTELGLYRFNREKNVFTDLEFDDCSNSYLKNENVTSICKDKNDNLWIGTRFNGIVYLNLKKKRSYRYYNDKAINHSVSNNAIHTIYNDSSNVIWIGTLGSGVCTVDCEAKKFYNIPEIKDKQKGISSNNIMAFREDKEGNLWIGTFGSGVFKLNALKNEVKNYSQTDEQNSFQGKSAFGFIADKNSDTWIASSMGGINKYDNGKETFSNFKFSETSKNDVYALIDDNENPEKYLWAGTSQNGVLKFDKEKKEFESVAAMENSDFILSSNRIRSLLFDNENNLWIGTITNGLNRINLNNKEVKIFTPDPDKAGSLSDSQIKVILQDKKNNLWFGTHRKGINKFLKENENFETYTTEEGLPNNSIQGILEDEAGNLWISTNKGLCKFNPSEMTFRNYDAGDGLQSNEFNEGAYYKSKNGTFYFGGINGYNYFRPNEIEDNPYVPNIVITDFQIFNTSVESSSDNPFIKTNISETKEINLSYRESVFSFEFATLSFNNPAKNQYAYMMDGFDKDWIYSGTRRFATYTNLEPGKYTFKVKGSNNDGVWNEKGASVKIFISPPFWKTWWFKTLGVTAIASATGLAYTQKLAKIEKEKKSQEDFSRKLIESQEAERKNLAFALHHTVAHDILITKNKAVIGLRKPEDSEAVKNVLNEISDLASNTLNDVRSISYNLHPHQIERLGMTKAIRSIVNNVSKSTDIKFSESIENVDKILSKELEINIFRIIQECISNVIKHSNATEASLSVMNDNKTLVITIWDNGKGISGDRKYGLGLTGITERIKLYKGELVIESAPSKGTLIVISVPITESEL